MHLNVAQLEEANRHNENLKAENISELERVEAVATALQSSHASTVARLEEANRRNGEPQGGEHLRAGAC